MYFNSYIPTNSRDVLRNMYGFKMENNKSNLIILDAEKTYMENPLILVVRLVSTTANS